MRMHFDALQASGLNTRLTRAVRASGASATVAEITPEHLTPHFALLENLGIPLTADEKIAVSEGLLSASRNVGPALVAHLQQNDMHDVQRSIHWHLLELGRNPKTSTTAAWQMDANRPLHPSLREVLHQPLTSKGHVTWVDYGDEDDTNGDGDWDDPDVGLLQDGGV